MPPEKVKNKPKPRPKKEWNPYEAAIFMSTKRARQPLSIREIAKRTKMHWLTASKHIKELEKRGKIKSVEKGKRRKWKI